MTRKDARPLHLAWLGHHSARLGGGIATYSKETTAGLRQRGVKVTFFHHATRNSEPDHEDEDAVALQTMQLVKPLVISPKGARRQVMDRLRRDDFDLVHASFWFSSFDFDLPRRCHEMGIPIVATFHVAFDQRPSLWGGITNAAYRLYAPALAECDRVIVFSQAQRDLLESLGVPGGALRILPNGVDVEKYSPGPSTARSRLQAERIFLYMGRIDAEKNVDDLLEAFLAIDPPAGTRLLIMGSGSDRRRLERNFRDPRIVFLGYLANEAERIDILRGSDAFFLPSSVEGLSLSMLEAMSCGVATVATDVGGDGDAVRGAGLVLDPTAIDSELQFAFRQLIELPWLGRRLGDLARERILERYSLGRNLDRLVELYSEVVPRQFGQDPEPRQSGGS